MIVIPAKGRIIAISEIGNIIKINTGIIEIIVKNFNRLRLITLENSFIIIKYKKAVDEKTIRMYPNLYKISFNKDSEIRNLFIARIKTADINSKYENP